MDRFLVWKDRSSVLGPRKPCWLGSSILTTRQYKISIDQLIGTFHEQLSHMWNYSWMYHYIENVFQKASIYVVDVDNMIKHHFLDKKKLEKYLGLKKFHVRRPCYQTLENRGDLYWRFPSMEGPRIRNYIGYQILSQVGLYLMFYIEYW